MKLFVLLISCAFSISIYKVTYAFQVNGEFLELPRNQYIVKGNSATVSCIARGSEAHWIISGIALTAIHQADIDDLKALGVKFNNTNQSSDNISTHYLSITVPPCAIDSVTDIICVVKDGSKLGGRQNTTSPVNIFVFKTLQPLAPNLTVDVIYNTSHLPQLTLILTKQPLWQGYEISEFRVNITNISDGSLLTTMTVPIANTSNLSMNETVTITATVNRSLFESTTNHCYSLGVSASAYSPQYGVGESTQMETSMFQTPGKFMDQGVNHENLFNSNGSLSHVYLQIKLPDVCAYQPMNYTIVITETGGDQQDSDTIVNGPHYHVGAGVVSNVVRGLRKNRNYSARVLVVSVTGTSESNTYLFSTSAEFDTCLEQRFSVVPPTTAMDSSLKLIIGVSVSITSIVGLLLIAFTVPLLCFCVRRRIGGLHGNHSRSRVHTSMVPNPIYDGPLYDIVQPSFERSAKRRQKAAPTSQPLSQNNHNQSLKLAMDGATNLDEDHKPLTKNFYSEPNDVRDSMSKASLSAKAPPVRSNSYEQHMLHLTAPPSVEDKGSSNSGFEQDFVVKVEETYVEMRKTGTISSQQGKNNTLV